jgi:hypothetical protein
MTSSHVPDDVDGTDVKMMPFLMYSNLEVSFDFEGTYFVLTWNMHILDSSYD